MNDNIIEITGNTQEDKEFNEWAANLERMSDEDASREIFRRIYYHSDLDQYDKDVLKDAYEYCRKLIDQGKPMEIELLKIYLEDIKGHEKIPQVDLALLISLLGCCGIVFTK